MKGARLLILVGAGFFCAFIYQRCRSPFLRIADERDLATRVAAASGLTAVQVMALRELLGVDLPEAAVRDRSIQLATELERLGAVELAVLAVAGHRDVAERVLSAAEGDVVRALELLAPLPEAIAAVRFAAMTRRFSTGLDG